MLAKVPLPAPRATLFSPQNIMTSFQSQRTMRTTCWTWPSDFLTQVDLGVRSSFPENSMAWLPPFQPPLETCSLTVRCLFGIMLRSHFLRREEAYSPLAVRSEESGSTTVVNRVWLGCIAVFGSIHRPFAGPRLGDGIRRITVQRATPSALRRYLHCDVQSVLKMTH